jgi:ribose/xylose/arabinose/galactoside ABC-type transport system permease subunit
VSAVDATRRSSFGARILRQRVLNHALLIGTVLLAIAFATQSDAFLTFSNIRNILLSSAILMVLAVPMALLMLSGEVDLSVGSTLAVSGVVAGLLLTSGSSEIVAILGAVAVGTLVGVAHGFLVTVLGLSAIIVTLGSLTVGRGIALSLAPQPLFDFGDVIVEIGRGRLVGVPYLVIVAGVVLLIGLCLLNATPWGRHIHAIGVNREAAYLSGIRVNTLTWVLFAVMGAAAGLAGVMMISRLNSAPSGSLGIGLELDVLTAVLLGGVAFGGGRGSLFGVFLGVLLLGILQNGLVINNVPASWALTVKGGVLVLAAGLDQIKVKYGAADTRSVSFDDDENHDGEARGRP